MGIEKAQTPNFDKIIRHNWPENYNEDSYAQVSHGEVEAAGKTTQGTAAVQQMGAAVSSTMTGMTADAAAEKYAQRTSALSQRGEFHSNRAVVAGLHAANIANTKGQLNAVAASFEAQSQALKVKAVSTGMTQPEVQKAHDQIVDEHQQAADKVGENFKQSNDDLNKQFTEGGDPSVPSTMAGPPAGGGDGSGGGDAAGGGSGGSGSGMPSLPPEVGQQMQQLLGQGTGMAQGMMGQLSGMMQHTPGADMVQQLGSLFQGMGQGGQAEVTPDQLDKLLAGQDHHDGSNSGGGDSPPSTLADDVKPDPSDSKPSDSSGGGAGAATTVSHGDTGSHAPSPAAQPVSAAPPASASVPTTQLSGDTSAPPQHAAPAGASTSMSGAGGGGVSAPSAPSVAPTADTSAGTQLSGSSTATAQTASLGTPTSAPLGSGAGMGSGMMGGAASSAASMSGGMMGGGAPSMGGGMLGGGAGVSSGSPAPAYPTHAPAQAPHMVQQVQQVAPTAAAPAPVAPPATAPSAAQAPLNAAQPGVAPTAQQANLSAPVQGGAVAARTDGHGAGGAPIATPFPVVVSAPLEGTIYHQSQSRSVDERAAGTVISALITAFAHGGLVGPIGVAILEDGTSVFCTADGLGVLPHGTRLPENVIPLAEFPSVGELFRTDMTGCVNPGYVLKVAAEVGIIPPVRVIVATDEGSSGEGVVRITADMLKGAPYMNTPVTRDMFSGVADDDVPLALESLKQTWGVEPDTTDTTAADMDMFNARWDRINTDDAVPALVRYLLTDAQICVEKGLISEAAYVLRQLLYLPARARSE